VDSKFAVHLHFPGFSFRFGGHIARMALIWAISSRCVYFIVVVMSLSRHAHHDVSSSATFPCFGDEGVPQSVEIGELSLIVAIRNL
jgi:hypothetical protein